MWYKPPLPHTPSSTLVTAAQEGGGGFPGTRPLGTVRSGAPPPQSWGDGNHWLMSGVGCGAPCATGSHWPRVAVPDARAGSGESAKDLGPLVLTPTQSGTSKTGARGPCRGNLQSSVTGAGTGARRLALARPATAKPCQPVGKPGLGAAGWVLGSGVAPGVPRSRKVPFCLSGFLGPLHGIFDFVPRFISPGGRHRRGTPFQLPGPC